MLLETCMDDGKTEDYVGGPVSATMSTDRNMNRDGETKVKMKGLFTGEVES